MLGGGNEVDSYAHAGWPPVAPGAAVSVLMVGSRSAPLSYLLQSEMMVVVVVRGGRVDGGGKKDLNLNCPSKAHHQKKASWELFFIIRTPLNWFRNKRQSSVLHALLLTNFFSMSKK